MSEFEHRYEVLVKSFIDSAQQNFFGKGANAQEMLPRETPDSPPRIGCTQPNSALTVIWLCWCAVRELENAFFEKCVAQTQAELEEFAAGKLDDISEDAQMFLADKDVVMTAWTQSHDSHLGKID